MKNILVIFFITIFNIYSNFAKADCDYKMSVPNLTYTVSDSNSQVSEDISISLSNENYTSCSKFFITFDNGLYASGYNRKAKKSNSNAYVFYNIYKQMNSSSILKGPNDAVSINEVLDGNIERNQTKIISYYFSYLQPDSLPPVAGTYIDTIRLNTFRSIFPNYENNEKNKNFTLSIIVPKFSSLSLVDSGGTYDPNQNMKILDFGELVTNQELGFDIRMVSNAGFRLKISSSNNGTMNIPGSTDLNSRVAYNFYVNNQAVNLTNSQSLPVTIASGNGVTPAGGSLVSLKTIIQSVEGKNFGIYQDYLTLTIMTTE